MDPKELREQAIKEAKCQLILNAAHKVFAEKGYWEARLEDIAATVGFSKASLYNYYPDKEAIFISLAIRENKIIHEKIEADLQIERPFFVALESILRIVISHYKEHYAILVNMSNFQNMMTLHRDMVKHPELFKEFFESSHRNLTPLRVIIERGSNNKEISTRLDPSTLAFFIGSLIQSQQMMSLRMGKPIEIEMAMGQIMDFLRHGFGTDKEEVAGEGRARK